MSRKVTPKRRPGRPPLPPGIRQSEWIKFRVRADVRRQLVANAAKAGMTLSVYLKERGLAS